MYYDIMYNIESMVLKIIKNLTKPRVCLFTILFKLDFLTSILLNFKQNYIQIL